MNKYKVGDIIYPHYNGTGVWYKTSRWDLVIGVTNHGSITDVVYFYSSETIRLIEMLIGMGAIGHNEFKKLIKYYQEREQ